MKILIAEDDKNISNIISESIKKFEKDIDIVVFEEAQKALEHATSNAIDIFILDIQLKDYKGTHLAKQLREINRYKYSPIVFVTALASEELLAYRELKCYSFLIKPFTKSEINVVLDDVIGYKKQLKSVSKTIENKIQGMEIEVERIYGNDRYETAIKVSQERFNNGEASSVILVEKDAVVDGLAAAPLAVSEEAPILFADVNSLNDETK